ncbi:MAG TPA: hypothetical protein VN641_11865 [Urbifossiella sp.]|nr:hypothetical protein [Urbifossiella sp.]
MLLPIRWNGSPPEDFAMTTRFPAMIPSNFPGPVPGVLASP